MAVPGSLRSGDQHRGAGRGTRLLPRCAESKLEQPALKRDDHGRDLVAGAKLVHDATQVELDGLRRNRQDLADLRASLAILAALEDLELARRERAVRRLVAPGANDRALERVLGIDADDLQRGSGALAEVRLAATCAEQRYRNGRHRNRDDEPVPGVECTPLVDDRLLVLAQIAASADVAPRVRIEGVAQLRHQRIAEDGVLFKVALDELLRPIVHQDALDCIAAGASQENAADMRQAEPFQLLDDEVANLVVVREALEARHEIQSPLAVLVATHERPSPIYAAAVQSLIAQSMSPILRLSSARQRSAAVSTQMQARCHPHHLPRAPIRLIPGLAPSGTCAISGRSPASRKPDATQHDITCPCGSPAASPKVGAPDIRRLCRGDRLAGARRRASRAQ